MSKVFIWMVNLMSFLGGLSLSWSRGCRDHFFMSTFLNFRVIMSSYSRTSHRIGGVSLILHSPSTFTTLLMVKVLLSEWPLIRLVTIPHGFCAFVLEHFFVIGSHACLVPRLVNCLVLCHWWLNVRRRLTPLHSPYLLWWHYLLSLSAVFRCFRPYFGFLLV